MSKKSTALFVGLLTLLSASMSLAQCPFGSEREGRGRGHRGHMMGPRMMEMLNLTPEQKTEIEEIKKEMKADAEPLRTQLGNLRGKMKELWSADVPNESAILDVEKQMHDVRGKLHQLKIQMKLDVMAILTPEQKSKFKELRSQFKGKRGKRGHRNGKGGGCPYADEVTQ